MQARNKHQTVHSLSKWAHQFIYFIIIIIFLVFQFLKFEVWAPFGLGDQLQFALIKPAAVREVKILSGSYIRSTSPRGRLWWYPLGRMLTFWVHLWSKRGCFDACQGVVFPREAEREKRRNLWSPTPSPLSWSLCLPVVAGIRSLFCPSHLIDQSRSFVLMLDFFKLSNCHAMFYDVESTLQASRTTTILPGTILR